MIMVCVIKAVLMSVNWEGERKHIENGVVRKLHRCHWDADLLQTVYIWNMLL